MFGPQKINTTIFQQNSPPSTSQASHFSTTHDRKVAWILRSLYSLIGEANRNRLCERHKVHFLSVIFCFPFLSALLMMGSAKPTFILQNPQGLCPLSSERPRAFPVTPSGGSPDGAPRKGRRI